MAISGLSSGTKNFAKAGTQIAPAFTRNDLAIQPGYVVPARFKRNATETRSLSLIPDWAAFQKAKPAAKTTRKK